MAPDVYQFFGIVVASHFASLVLLLGLNLETPRWLLQNGRREEAIRTLNFIAWFNGVEERIPDNTQFVEAQNQVKSQEAPINTRSRADSISSASDAYLFTDMDFKAVYAHSKRANLEEKQLTSEFTLAIEFVVLSFMHMFISQLYVLAYLMIAKLGGDINVNGIVLAIAEGVSSMSAGYAMGYMSDLNVVRVALLMCIVFNLLYYYQMGPEYPILQYFVLFVAIFGQYAPLGATFVIQEQRIPPKYLGSASVLIYIVFGPLGMSAVPYIAI